MSLRRSLALALIVLLAGLAGFAGWLLDSTSGARWASARAVALLNGKLAIGELDGTLLTPLSVGRVHYRDPEQGIDVTVQRATLHLAARELLSWRAHVLDAQVSGVAVLLFEPTKAPEKSSEPFSLKPPIDIIIERFTLDDARVAKDGSTLFEATRALLVAGWTSRGVGIRQLNVVSPQGRIDLHGTVAQQATYSGDAAGSFSWHQGDFTYAGNLKLASERGLAHLQVQLSSPLAAQLGATAQQDSAVPWTMTLAVPRFDPRQKLLPDGSIESLMVALKGEGDRAHAHVSGEVELNGARVFIDPIELALQDQVLKIERLALRDARRSGVLEVAGNVRLDKDPFYADLALNWHDVVLPKEVAGQILASHGELHVRGNARLFDTRGELAIGPPGRLADIALLAHGSEQAIELEKFEIQQQQGSLTATGRIDLKPEVRWSIDAGARKFDPGALFSEWPGSLGFTLATRGRLVEAGPDATLKLNSLSGTLRKRAIGGAADLRVTPNKVVTGTLQLSSGRSTIKVTGAGGEKLDLSADLKVASMEDWLPDAHGQLNAHVTARGDWPKVALTASVKGAGLSYDKTSVRNVTLDADITEPLHPHGSLSASARDIASADFAFSAIELKVEGSESQHSAQLKATGKPVSAELSVSGARLDSGWAGTLNSLRLEVERIEALSLREPVQIKVAGGAFEVSQSCLTNSQLSVCAAARQSEAGELQANYTLEHLPLALIVALTQPDLGYIVKGVIEGKGDIRRTKTGELFGSANLLSASGSIAEENAEADPLLSYTTLNLAANLEGQNAHATAQMAFNDGGTLSAELAVGQITSAAPTLDGHGKLAVGDLAPIGLFVTQLANIKGSASGEARIAGTTAAPILSGSAQLRDFGAEVPQLGLDLKDGHFEANAGGAGAIAINGAITSGKGQLKIEGAGESISSLALKISGEDFLAADIPAAKVVVDPDLAFSLKDERMDLTGTLLISSAAIDVTKLPKGTNVTQASSDVVVVDDPTPQVKASKSMQLYTHVTVVLGEGMRATELRKVSLVGFGLDAHLGGQLVVNESPGADPLGVGEIRLEGKYKAYGQDLTIQSGRLLYANTPLSDPQLDIVAIREVEEVTAKLTVRGSAQGPILEVSADPSMPQTAALSYLVTGKPIDQLGSGEGDIVQSAARSLGGAAGNLLAKSLGKRLGIDEIGIDNSTEIGGSAFTVGQYLSPRLYISYGVGLFEPGQVVTLRYRLSRALNVEASQGPKSQRAGINYRREK